jgi:2-amino-4-hydroxy-6-hydroxymethyldihydropteridine diphosphokinase
LPRVAIALGSNLGDRRRLLDEALAALAAVVDDLHISTFHETNPEGVGAQPRFLNAAAIGHTTLEPADLLTVMLEIERTLGRERPHIGAPRTVDLDLILYGDVVLDEPGVTVPHPRFRDRRFVLEPLAEIAADWVDPVTGETIRELLRAVKPRRREGHELS